MMPTSLGRSIGGYYSNAGEEGPLVPLAEVKASLAEVQGDPGKSLEARGPQGP